MSKQTEQNALPPLQLPALNSHRNASSTTQQTAGRPVVGGDSRPQRHVPNSIHGSVARILPPLHDAGQQQASPAALSPGVDQSIASTSARTRATHPQPMYQPQPKPDQALRHAAQSALSPSDSISPPKTWAAGTRGDVGVAPLSVPQLINELIMQNQLLECRLTESTPSASGGAQVAAPPPKLCDLCDDDTPKQRAVYYCEECRRLGQPFEFCDACWADEHRSRRTRDHRRIPIPLVTTTTDTDHTTSTTTSLANVIDARAVLSLQQQVLQLLMHVMPRSLRECTTQTDAAIEPRPAAPSPSAPAAAAVSGSLFTAPPFHVMANEVKMLLLEERAEREAIFAKAQSALLCDFLQHRHFVINVTEVFEVPQQVSDDAMEVPTRQPQQPALGRPPMSPPAKDRSHNAVAVPPLALAPGSIVEVVHGEKHLPGQRHMLLVRFASGEEDWVPAEAVQYQAEVRRYMQRKGTPDPGASAQRPVNRAAGDAAVAGSNASSPNVAERPRTFGRELSPVGVFELDSGAAGPYQSALGDTERQELAAQLAALQRIGTAGSVGLASRGSLLGPDEFVVPPAAQQANGADSSDDDDEEVAAQAKGGEVPPATSSQRNTPRRPLGPVTFRDDVKGGEEPASPGSESAGQSGQVSRRQSNQGQPPAPPPVPAHATPPMAQPSTPPPRQNQRPQPNFETERGPYVTYRRALQSNPNAPPPPPSAVVPAPAVVVDDPESVAARQADEDVVRQYEQRVRLIEERQRQVRKMREEQEERLRALREKQQATDETKRQKIHAEYEEHEKTLAREQPEVQHPLYLTNDRHAALLLHKLHEEIAQAEKEKAARDEYRAKRASRPRSDNGGLDHDNTTAVGAAEATL